MNFCKQCVNCYGCSYWAFTNSIFINSWQCLESFGLSCLHCSACSWALCAPLCIDGKIGSGQAAKNYCLKGLKYCCLACGLNCLLPIDAVSNCFKTCAKTCGEDKLVKHHFQLVQNSQTYGKSLINFIGVELQGEPMKLMRTVFQP